MSEKLGALLMLIALAALTVKGAHFPSPPAVPTLKGIIRQNAVGDNLWTHVPMTVTGANATESDSFGQFTLNFPEKHIDQWGYVLVTKYPYLVVNDVQLELSLPANPDANGLIIILSLPEARDENVALFYLLKSFAAIEVA